MAGFASLDTAAVAGKRVVLRTDLNVPTKDGVITDLTRIERAATTIKELAEKGARVIVLCHFGRPKGVEEKYSQKFLVEPLAKIIGRPVEWSADVIGADAVSKSKLLPNGGVLLMENVRFHPEEEKNDPEFAKSLAALGDLYVNDAFSAAHRAHASTEGMAHLLPRYAGRLMQAELEALGKALDHPQKPVAALVGGAKVSTKLDLLGNLVAKVDVLIIGGGMANTFLFAQGFEVGKSLCERDLADTAREILEKATRGQLRDHPADRRGGGRRFRRACPQSGGDGGCGAGRSDDPGCRSGQRGRHRQASGKLQDPGVERPLGRLRDRALRRRHQSGGARRGGCSPKRVPCSPWRAAEIRFRRWRMPVSRTSSPTFPPPAAPSSNGWKEKSCRG